MSLSEKLGRVRRLWREARREAEELHWLLYDSRVIVAEKPREVGEAIALVAQLNFHPSPAVWDVAHSSLRGLAEYPLPELGCLVIVLDEEGDEEKTATIAYRLRGRRFIWIVPSRDFPAAKWNLAPTLDFSKGGENG